MPELEFLTTAVRGTECLNVPLSHYEKRLFFESLAPEWDAHHRSPIEDARIPSLVSRFGLNPGDRVLDMGCGTGKLVPFLLERVGRNGSIIEADFSCGMLKVAASKDYPANVRCVQTDALYPAFRPDSFDAIICFSFFPHLEDQAGALAGFHRLLKPGKTLTIAHSLSRSELNAYFIEKGGPVRCDHLPSDDIMKSMLARTGFRSPEILDRPDGYVLHTLR